MSTPPTSQPSLTPQDRYDAALAALRPRHRRFVVEYLRDLHQRNAAIRAGYAAASADSQASELRRNPKIADAIRAGLDLAAMPAAEILARLTRIARGSIADVLQLPDGSELGPAGGGWSLDLAKAQETGAIHLVRKIREGEHGPEVELYSAHEALVKLGEYHKLWGRGADLMKLVDLTRLSDAQIERLAEGEDPLTVLLG